MRNLGNLNEWTKVELAQVINQALLNKDEPLPADHFRVQRMAKRSNKSALVHNCELALTALARKA